MNVEQETGEVFESLQPEICFNPILQHFYDSLLARAVDNQEKLPPISKAIDDYARPDKVLFEEADDAIKHFKSLFTLKQVEKAKKNTSQYLWKKIIEDEKVILKQKEMAMIAQSGLAKAKPGMEGNGNPMDIEIPERLSLVDPISDFQKMVGQKQSVKTQNTAFD